jgi:hypothetical protein
LHTFPVDLSPESCLPKKQSRRKQPPKKPTRGRKPTKKAAKASTNNEEKDFWIIDWFLIVDLVYLIPPIDWLNTKKNYDACFGTGKAPLGEQPPKGTINGFELMAINLQNQSFSKISLSSRQMKDCFNSYKNKYKKTHTLSLATGFGLL